MPLYRYKCPTCSKQADLFRKIDERDLLASCSQCSFAMNRQLSAPAVRGDYEGYACPITGAWIEGRKAHQENLRRHGCRVLEPGEKDEVIRRKAAGEAALDRSIEATVDEFVETLPTAKREKLIAEVEGGLDVQVIRN